jgi:hypothetical protein
MTKFDIWYKKTYLFSKYEYCYSPSDFKKYINRIMPSFNNDLQVSYDYRYNYQDNFLVTAWAK